MPTVKSEITVGNLTSILTVLITFGGLIWYQSSEQTDRRNKDADHDRQLSQILSDRDARRKLIDERIEFIMRSRAGDSERVARIEEQIKFIAETVARIDRKTDRASIQP